MAHRDRPSIMSLAVPRVSWQGVILLTPLEQQPDQPP